jgi:hypothetical protein
MGILLEWGRQKMYTNFGDETSGRKSVWKTEMKMG